MDIDFHQQLEAILTLLSKKRFEWSCPSPFSMDDLTMSPHCANGFRRANLDIAA
jgi:hypothetical protein